MSMKSLPNLFIPGAAKSGTTTLHGLFDQHPDISMSTNKEPHYWTHKNFDGLTDADLNEYLGLFNFDDDILYQGEASTGSMFFDEFIDRIKAAYKETPKFIFILRNPIDRCYSHYWWLKGMGFEKKSFHKALEKDRSRSFTTYHDYPTYYYHFGRYAHWLKRFYDAFGTDNIFVISLESLRADPLTTVNTCFAFLGLAPLEVVQDMKANETVILKNPRVHNTAKKIARGKYKFTKVAKYFLSTETIDKIREWLVTSTYKSGKTAKKYPKLSEKDRTSLKELYIEDVKALKELTGLPFEEWPDFA